MKSEWKVRKIAYPVGPAGYQVYRLMDKEEPELPFNMEFLWMDYATREEAEAMAKKLNAEEKAK